MITKNIRNVNSCNEVVSMLIDELVPKDHLLRKIDVAIDFSFIYDLVEDKYSTNTGRSSIDLAVLFKIVFIQYMFGIKLMHQTIKEIETNLAYRWFLGYWFNDKIPHFSTFGKNYSRRFKDTDIFEQIFVKILEQAIEHGFIDSDTVFIDATHVKTNANKKKIRKETIEIKTKIYIDPDSGFL